MGSLERAIGEEDLELTARLRERPVVAAQRDAACAQDASDLAEGGCRVGPVVLLRVGVTSNEASASGSAAASASWN